MCVKYMEQVLWEFRDKMVEVEWTVLERICGGGELKRHAQVSKSFGLDFPGSPVVENLPVNAAEGHRSGTRV